jgi:hypothetical protein
MPNITMTLDADVLRRARRAALDRGGSLTSLVRAYLEDLVHRETDAREKAVARLERIWTHSHAVVGPVRWTRGDLHGR